MVALCRNALQVDMACDIAYDIAYDLPGKTKRDYASRCAFICLVRVPGAARNIRNLFQAPGRYRRSCAYRTQVAGTGGRLRILEHLEVVYARNTRFQTGHGIDPFEIEGPAAENGS